MHLRLDEHSAQRVQLASSKAAFSQLVVKLVVNLHASQT
jgi:hypothetical protein